MTSIITKTYDVPVYQNWYEVKLEVDRRTAERWIFVEFKEEFHQKGEGEHSCTDVVLGEADKSKTVKVTIDTDDDGEYMFILSIDGLPLGDYMNEYKARYTTWTIEKLGSKSKLTLDEENNIIYFKRTEITTRKTHPSFEEFIWEGEYKEEYKFRVVKTLRGMGQFSTALFVNGAENQLEFIPRRG